MAIEPKQTGKTVTMTEEQFQGLMQRIESVEIGKGIRKPKRVTEREATVRFYEGKPVIKYSNFKEKLEEGKRVGYIDITLYGEDKPVTVQYLNFLNNENNVVKVKILSQKAEEITEVQGKVRSRNPDEAGISSKSPWQSNEVDLEVISYKYQVEVEVLDGEFKGQKYTFDAAALNA